MFRKSKLPEFRYVPDPIAAGMIAASDEPCEVCDRARGFRYTGPVYAVAEVETICPWCIADGSAAAHYKATFTTADNAPPGVRAKTIEIITSRTPGFPGWQQERWLFHCGDGAAFLRVAGWDDLAALPDALETLRSEASDYRWSDDEVEQYLRRLDPEGPPTAYLFRCLHCGTHLAYSDST